LHNIRTTISTTMAPSAVAAAQKQVQHKEKQMATSKKFKHDFWNHAEDDKEEIEQAKIENEILTNKLISTQNNNNNGKKDENEDDDDSDAEDDDNESIKKCNKMIKPRVSDNIVTKRNQQMFKHVHGRYSCDHTSGNCQCKHQKILSTNLFQRATFYHNAQVHHGLLAMCFLK